MRVHTVYAWVADGEGDGILAASRDGTHWPLFYSNVASKELREIIDNCARDAARDTGKTVRLVKFVRVQDTEVVEGGRNAKEGKTD